MKSILRYGLNATLELELGRGVLAGQYDGPQGVAPTELPERVREALAHPHGFPSLARSVVPGDRVAIALERSVPGAATVVAAIVESVVDSGVSPENISIVHPPEERAADLLQTTSDSLPDQVRHSVHDPSDRGQLCYLAASGGGDPIYVNRVLQEADLIVSVGCLRADSSLNHYGVALGWFPAFSDTRTIQRYCSPTTAESASRRARLQRDAEEANWLLGNGFAVQVVPAADGQVLHVLAGEAGAVVERGRQRWADAWRWPVSRRAKLVVAGIPGNAAQQTWENVARALSAAAMLLDEEGDVALCTELQELPGPGLSWLADCDDLPSALRQLGRERPIDALLAARVAQAVQSERVYLLSRLDAERVESLGIAPVAAPSEIARLVSRAPSCILLGSAQFATPLTLDSMEPRGTPRIPVSRRNDA